MGFVLHYLPEPPEYPSDKSVNFQFGTPEYDKARQEFCRDLRHYRSSLRSHTKRCLKLMEERDNGAN